MSRGPGCWSLVIVIGALTAAGCGGGGKDSADTSKTTATTESTTQPQTTAPAAAKLKLARLEKNLPKFLNSGRVNVGTPGGGSAPIRAEVSEASCPKEVEKKVGTTFRCTVKGTGGVSGHIDITFTDPSGGTFTYKADISGGPFGKFSGKVGG